MNLLTNIIPISINCSIIQGTLDYQTYPDGNQNFVIHNSLLNIKVSCFLNNFFKT